jgi:hypothetical protein
LEKAGINLKNYSREYIESALDTCRGKIKLFSELPSYCGFYFKEEVNYDSEAVKTHFIPDKKLYIIKLRDAFNQLSDFKAEQIEMVFKTIAKELGVKSWCPCSSNKVSLHGRNRWPKFISFVRDTWKRIK